jgi:hypothetical protein
MFYYCFQPVASTQLATEVFRDLAIRKKRSEKQSLPGIHWYDHLQVSCHKKVVTCAFDCIGFNMHTN